MSPRVRMDLDDGAYMDVTLDDDATSETLDALRQLGNAAAARMRPRYSTSFDSRRVATRRPRTPVPTAPARRRRRHG